MLRDGRGVAHVALDVSFEPLVGEALTRTRKLRVVETFEESVSAARA